METEGLMRQYALHGVRDWGKSKNDRDKTRTERMLGARIAHTEYLAVKAIYPQRPVCQRYFIPTPELSVSNIDWAFFLPRRASADAELMFDLVFSLPGSRHIGFRLEPGHRNGGGRHGYGHVQLNSRYDGKEIEPEKPLDWLPNRYPAFPLPGAGSLDRFLMLVVALHGFPNCTQTVLRSVCERPMQFRSYFGRAQHLLSLRDS